MNSAIQQLINRLEEQLQMLVASKKVPGLSVAIFQKDVLNWQAGFGYSNVEEKLPVYPAESRFRAASVSKPIAACALAVMVSEGLIDLETSFYDYVPYFPPKQYDFNIRQLASHTAGIRGYRGKEFALNRPYSIKDSLEVFQNDPLLFKPGTRFHYNSYGFVLLSLAMQEASGRPFEDYTSEKVLKPLGMTNTIPEKPYDQLSTTSDQRPTTNRQATFYTRSASGFRKASEVDNRFKIAGGGYLTTVQDMVKLGNAVLDEKFYPEAMSVLLQSQHTDGKNTYYGLGWEVSEDTQGRCFYGHIGNQVGGYSYFRVFPETELIVAVLVNCTNPKIQDILDEIVEEIHERVC
jgi:CubicO group peptidase (beta-lactamase class C family)